jgi:hypothetical protein
LAILLTFPFKLSFSRARKKLYKLLFMPPAMSLVHNLSRLSLLPSVRVRLLHQIFRWIKH